MRTIDQYFDEFTSVNGSNIGYPVMYDYPENEPESLKHIGDRFMQYANSVETLVFKSTEPPLCNEVFMSYNKNLTKVYVPKASIDKYKNNFKYILGNRTNQQLLAIEDMPEDLKVKLL